MGKGVEAVIERFVVEDVLVGLGNIRARLAEVAAAEARGEAAPALQLALIATRIDLLEAQARRLQVRLHPPAADEPGPLPVFASRRSRPPEAPLPAALLS